MRVAIAAAGTGGHVFPALAVAEALVEEGMGRGDVLFLGGDRIEAGAVPDAGFPFHGFRLARLRRSLSPRNLAIPATLRSTAREMAGVLDGAGVKAVLGMSGYVTVPAVWAARRLGIPFHLHEQNSRPGLAARHAARRSDRVLLGLPGDAERLPGAEVVGNPLRPALRRFSRGELRAEARRHYGVDGDDLVLGILGGSLGAGVLNDAVPGLVAGWDGPTLSLLHLTGADARDDMVRRAAAPPLPWRVEAFEDRMELFYAAVDMVVSRAGAMAVSELAATGTPAILVPLERVGQQHNAAAAARAGAADVLPQVRIAELPAEVRALADDPQRRGTMSRAGGALTPGDAAVTVARALVEAAGG